MAFISAILAGGQNRVAFLDMLGISEGTVTSPATVNNGYDVIVTGIDRKPEIFSDYSCHPFSHGRPSKVINSDGLTSNASGRYQHMLRDYAYYKGLLALPDFGPLSQDRWALQLIKERRALAMIDAGQIQSAIAACRNIWASLPGAGYNQHENSMLVLQRAFVAAGGRVAI
jgi:muramidase (phage lysozyme)